jgi:hypothetical protein
MGCALERNLGVAEGAVDAFGLPQQRRPSTRSDAGVLEVIEPTGELSRVVSNGCDRATCNSAAFAKRVKVSLG